MRVNLTERASAEGHVEVLLGHVLRGGGVVISASNSHSVIGAWLRARRLVVLVAVAVALLSSVAVASPAFAGKPATGDLLFSPCNACHPVVAGKALPNGFEGHKIKLQGHDVLGQGKLACLVCHVGPGMDPSQLKLIDGSTIDIKGDVALVCFRCHSAKYREWEAGIHGKATDKCTSAGCHDPHTPQYVFGQFLLPFVGSGFTAQVRSETATLQPLAAPPLPHPTQTPQWLWALTGLAFVGVGGLTASLIRGRAK